jgi:type I restriction enzyme M protein
MAQTNANLIWKIADLLRGPYQPNQYGDVILPGSRLTADG